MPDYYLGLMSGTSVDGIDAALMDLIGDEPRLVYAHTFAWPPELRQQILQTLAEPDAVSLPSLGRLHAALGEQFGEVSLAAIEAAGIEPGEIRAIGSHGQTLFHAPDKPHAFSFQAGDANRIAEITGITTVADFRGRDIAAGGQGAPLVPAFHQAVFHDPGRSRAVLNIGGIANFTLLPKQKNKASGFDTGPGNLLMDAWHQKHRGAPYDSEGAWARSGNINDVLLECLLDHPYFSREPPKSTGRELFNLTSLEEVLASLGGALPPEDVQRTLLEFTAVTIADGLKRFGPEVEQVLVCGGGAHNILLMQRLSRMVAPAQLISTEAAGLHPDWVEAAAFAWLAKQALEGRTGNLPRVTGARRAVVLGAVYRGAGSAQVMG